MPTDWLETLRENGALATKMSKEVPPVLSDPGLTLEHATRLFQSLDKHCRQAEQMLIRMEDADLPDELYEAAETLVDLWDDLARAASERMLELGGR